MEPWGPTGEDLYMTCSMPSIEVGLKNILPPKHCFDPGWDGGRRHRASGTVCVPGNARGEGSSSLLAGRKRQPAGKVVSQSAPIWQPPNLIDLKRNLGLFVEQF